MSTLNEPLGWEDRDADDEDWTPAAGLWKGTWHGLLVALVIAVTLMPIVAYAPFLLINTWLRLAAAFVVTRILFGVVHNAAGFTSWPCTFLAVGYALLLLLLSHVELALFGTATTAGDELGWAWLDPGVVAVMNFIPLVGVAGCAAMCHRGTFSGDTLAGILKCGVWGTRR